MSSVSQALVTAALTLTMAGMVGYGLYRAIAPKHKATRPIDIGRRWLAWMALLITVSSLPPFFRQFNVDSFLIWAIGLVFYGGLAFGLGWLYAKLFRFKGGNFGEGSAATVLNEGAEEDVYAVVAMETQRGDLHQGLWAKALSESECDEQRAKAKYIKFRAESLRSEQIRALRLQGAIQEEARQSEEQRQLAIQAQRRIFEEQERAAQLRRVADLKSRARNWGFAAMIPAWIAGVAFFMFTGAEFGTAGLISALVFAPTGGLLVYVVAAGIKLSGQPRPDKEPDKEMDWVWILVGGAILWAWLANKEPSTPTASNPALQTPVIQPKVAAPSMAPTMPKPQAPAVRPAEWKAPRYAEPKQHCVIKAVMTDDEIRRCRAKPPLSRHNAPRVGSEPGYGDSETTANPARNATKRYGDFVSTAAYGTVEEVKEAIDNGAYINGSNGQSTALISATRYNRPEIVRLLLSAGADVEVADKNGRTAMAHAKVNANSEVIEMLRSYGASDPFAK